ncbi:hypothetical protein ACFQH3_06815 [Haladaptatus sp. GCM10025707]|uniref:hypothetical protein n=1 Tax=Haladaptatus sp. GCM10025707 TaxID=3252658 RepID=UPI00361A4655
MSESPIRVLWLTPDKPEDISVGRRKIAEYLMTQGFDVTLRGTTPRTLVQSMRERNSYDVVVGTTRAGAIAGTLLSVVFSKPLLVDHIDPIRQFSETHPRWLSLPVRLLENVSFALADHVLYVYDEEAQRVRRYARLATQTDLGVSFDRFANPSDETLNRAQRRLDDEGVAGNVVIYVGGLEPIYNIEHLLEAMTYLSDWTLVVLGTGASNHRSAPRPLPERTWCISELFPTTTFPATCTRRTSVSRSWTTLIRSKYSNTGQ